MTTMLALTAPAKVNLYLHVTGKRSDGYHLLDSLFAFTKTGDRLFFKKSEKTCLEITGEFSPLLAGTEPADNLILKALSCLEKEAGRSLPTEIILEKNLPIAAGIGGGSADAATALEGIVRLYDLPFSISDLEKIALSIGADVPACLYKKPLSVAGIGEEISEAPSFPACSILLVNPRKPLSTPAVFKAYRPDFTSPDPLCTPCATQTDFIAAMGARKNDLTEAAIACLPDIQEVLDGLASARGCLLARMSGSGATCFGLFDTEESCQEALSYLKHKRPDDWYMADQIAS